MALSKRLLALYEMVEKGSIAADIGCDHAQLSIALVENGICPHVYACDLREQPLARAKEAIQAAGLTERITARLRNGIENLESDVSAVIIAGMGVETILTILSSQPKQLQANRKFIIQANLHVDKLRHWISENHFTIEKEVLVEEDHFYEIVCFSCRCHDSYSEQEQLFGAVMPKDALFERCWKQRRDKLEAILKQLPPQHIKRYELEQRKEMIERQLSDNANKTRQV